MKQVFSSCLPASLYTIAELLNIPKLLLQDDDECDDEPCQTGTCKVYGVYGRCKYEDVYDGQRCTPNVVTASDGGPYYVCCSGECVPGTTCTPPPDLCKDVRCGNCGKCIEWDGRAKCVEKEDACKGCAVCEKNNDKYECEGVGD